MDRFRTPFFVIALIALVLALGVELGWGSFLRQQVPVGGSTLDGGTPGLGIRYLAILDLLLLYGVAIIGLGLVLPRSLIGRLQGIAGLILSFLGCLGTLALLFSALTLLVIMLSLFVAVPFGTIAYLAAWGHFPVGDAKAVLATIMALKLAFCVFLVLAEQRFLKHKGLIVLTAVSLGATWLVAFLIAFPPFPLASIADVIAALVIAIVGLIWLVLGLIGALFAVISAIRSVPE